MTDAEGAKLQGAAVGTSLTGKAIALVVLVAACVSMACAQPKPITSLRAVRALSNAEADQSLPVQFEATVTYVRTYQRALYVQDGDAAIFVDWGTQNLLVPGDRVSISGTT